MTEDISETIANHPRITIAVLLIMVVAISTAYLQSQRLIEVTANLTEIWIFAVALPLLSLALALIIRSPRRTSKEEKSTVPSAPSQIPTAFQATKLVSNDFVKKMKKVIDTFTRLSSG